MENFDKI